MLIEKSDDLAVAVRRIVEGFRPAAEARSVELVLEAEPLIAQTDAGALQRVLGNLLSNALRFSPSGGRVEVRLGTADGRAWISVRDDGSGIAEEDQPRLFERAWRADSERPRDGHAGLGLTIASRFARLLGARIEVASKLGEGAVFTVRGLGRKANRRFLRLFRIAAKCDHSIVPL